MSVKRGDVVLFAVSGRTVNALVLATRSGEVDHLGSNDEPLISIAFSDPARETGLSKDKDGNLVYPFGRIPQIFIEHDVVHESHEFSEEFKRDKGISTDAQILSLRGHGEYSEYADPEAGDKIRELRSLASDIASQRNEAQKEAADLRGKLDVASEQLKKLQAGSSGVGNAQEQQS